MVAMRKLTEAGKCRINRRIRYLCSNQNPPRSFRRCDREYGPTVAVRSGVCRNGSRVFLFLGCPVQVNRGSGGFQHIGDIILDIFKQANDENEAAAELLEIGR